MKPRRGLCPGVHLGLAPGLAVALLLTACTSPHEYPLDYPLRPLTNMQVAEVASCDIEKLVNDYYPNSVPWDHLEDKHPPQSNCEWAALADAYARRGRGNKPWTQGLAAFEQSLAGNYGYALISPNFESYSGEIPLVQPPPIASKQITSVFVSYQWSGPGLPSVEYALSIEDANTDPVVMSDSPQVADGMHVDKAVVQDLAQGLSDLLPVYHEAQIQPCYDNSIDWRVVMTFEGGTKLTMETDSNLMSIGGPWQTIINGQAYLQASPAFADRIARLVQTLKLPGGEPGMMYCPGASVFQAVFRIP